MGKEGGGGRKREKEKEDRKGMAGGKAYSPAKVF